MNHKELSSIIANLMINYGPDGHCDGNELIATEIMDRVKEWKTEPVNCTHDWQFTGYGNEGGKHGFYQCSVCNVYADGYKISEVLKEI